MPRQRSRQFIAAAIVSVVVAAVVVASCSVSTITPGTGATTASELPQGDRLVRLLKKISDEALLLEPERMARELDIPMTFEAKPPASQLKPCEEGGSQRSLLITEGTASNSWYRQTPEGVPDMKIPAAFINPATFAGQPNVKYSAY